MNLKIFTDGGSRGNPGAAACAFVVYDSAGNLQEKCGKYLGLATNNEAEYQGVVEALRWVKGQIDQGRDITEVKFYLDSLLVVQQLNCQWKIKEARLQELFFTIKALEQEIRGKITYHHILRQKNKEADSVVNQTLDAAV